MAVENLKATNQAIRWMACYLKFTYNLCCFSLGYAAFGGLLLPLFGLWAGSATLYINIKTGKTISCSVIFLENPSEIEAQIANLQLYTPKQFLYAWQLSSTQSSLQSPIRKVRELGLSLTFRRWLWSSCLSGRSATVSFRSASVNDAGISQIVKCLLMLNEP